jgi:hypothetical protein
MESNTPQEITQNKAKKTWLIFLILGGLMSVGGVAMLLLAILIPGETLPDLEFPELPSTKESNNIYSDLTGLPLASAAEKTAPAYCIQTPNGNDGARPQAGLNQAGVVFEAIAEAGITRFAAIYQNPTSAVIGPIRSLRMYYLQWDVPFDCTIVHAGGADDALVAVRDYKHLSESTTYMYRGGSSSRRWNNLFTTSTYLAQMNADWEFGESHINGFSRMTPEESKKSRVDNLVSEKLVITKPASGDTSAMVAKVANVAIRFGWSGTYNVDYYYDLSTNSYNRNYEMGTVAEVRACPDGDMGEANPDDLCPIVQLSPSVVVAMVVQEQKAEDNYHEAITTIGSGEVYIFQNGTVLHGTWNKPSVAEQIRFYDDSGVEIKLAPGQTFVEAVPNYGGIEYS